MAYLGSTPTTQSFISGTDTFSGAGAQVAFTLTRAVSSVNDILVVVNNVDQQPSAYSVSGTTLTFTAAPSPGTNNVYVRYLSTTLQSIGVGDLSVSSEKIQDGAITQNKLQAGAVTGDKLAPGAAVPSGAVMFFAADAAPSGWIKANGAVLSRVTYSALFSAIGTTFGVGDGSTTFGVPDLRGEFPRGWDDGRGADSARAFGSAQGFAMQNLSGTVSADTGGSSGIFSGPSGVFTVSNGNSKFVSGGSTTGGTRYTAFSFNASAQAQTAAETRGRNVALLACIKF